MTETTILPRPMVLEEFSPLVGKMFLAHCVPEPVEIMLIDAKPSRVHNVDARPPFSLTFYTGPDVLLEDGIYALRCGDFGPDLVHFSSLVAPQGSQAGHYYQAIFN